MKDVKAYAAPSAAEGLGPITIERRPLEPTDVLIEIKYCGVCHSDVNHARSLWHPEAYPLVPGHEITGIVAEVGDEVTRHRVGDRVGVGCMVDTCGTCVNCRQGEEQYCLKGITLTYGVIDRFGQRTLGGYSTHIVVNEDFVLKIPEGLDLDVAAPLLCAGITTFWPLRHWGVGPGKSVAVVGLGGLGHVAVKIAHAMGAEVTVLSQSTAKRDDATRLGADHYYSTSDPATFETLANVFDVVLSTVSAPIDVDAYMSLLGLGGVMVNVGAPTEPLSMNAWSALRNRRIYTGSLIGSNADTQEMLDFCAEHNVGADIETISIDQVNTAFERLLASDVRYRFVIDIASLG
jgi:uncharacterized zinc-type alcohol dehydrogenase-like protein